MLNLEVTSATAASFRLKAEATRRFVACGFLLSRDSCLPAFCFRGTPAFWLSALAGLVASGFSRRDAAVVAISRLCLNEWQRPRAPVAGDRGLDHVREHVEEPRVVVDRFGADHRQPDVAADCGGLRVEVVEHLDVIADEADGADHRG